MVSGLDNSQPSKTDPRGLGESSLFDLREVLLIFFSILLVFLIYSSSLKGPFVLDDRPNIQKNPHLRLTHLTPDQITRAGFDSPMKSRPVAYISFGLNYYIHEYDVFGYHLVNILIHVATGIFLYLFLKTTLSLPSVRSRYEPYGWLPFIAALIWLIHPIQTQSVTYIVQRMNSMAAMFYILAFLLYSRARLAEDKKKKWALFAGCAFSGLLSLGSKEIAATLPFFIVLYEWYFLQDMSWGWFRGRFFLVVGILGLGAVVAFFYLGASPVERILSSYATRDFTLTERVLTQFRVVIFYLSLLVFPHPSRLNLDHDFALSRSLVDPVTTVLSMVAIVGLFVLAVYLARKRRLLSFCILWFLGNLVIESSVYGLEIIFEHRTYLPSMFAILAAVVLAHQGIKSKWLGAALVCIVVAVFSFWTYERNIVWSDKESLLRDCVAKSPNKTRTHNNLGHALILKGKLDEGISHFSKGLLLLREKRQELIALGKLQETRIHAHSMLGAEPDLKDLLNRLGLERFKKGEIQEATAYYRAALRVKPDFSIAHHNLGLALAAQGKFDEAVSHYYQTLRMTPDSAKLHNNLANALFKTGKVEESIRHYREALRLKPDYALAYNNLQIALAKQRQGKETIVRIQKAPGSEFEDPASNYRFGNFYRSEGNLDKAVEEYKKALSLQPGFIDAMNNLALVYVSRGEYDKAMPLYMRMMELQPDNYVAYYNTACLYARKSEIEESITWLKRAVKRGFKDWDYLKTDKDLENIRETPYFKELTSGN